MAKHQAIIDKATSTIHASSSGVSRQLLVGVIAFLTVVDLFATQAILPSLARAYHVDPAIIGSAVNATTFGMAISCLATSLLGQSIDRRKAIVGCLALLAVPTTLLAFAPNLAAFVALRVMQGLLMAAAFTMTLGYLANETSGEGTSAVFAAYITGNVASNLFGRLLSASIADTLGLAFNFYAFAVLNLTGAALVALTFGSMKAMPRMPAVSAPLVVWRQHLANQSLQAAFGIGFCILFAFLGTFTYVNFVLVQPPISLGMMSLGLVYFVFLPSIATTPLASRYVVRYGTVSTLYRSFALAAAGLPLLLVPRLAPVLLGMVLVAVGTFFAQATTTGFVGRATKHDPGSASGLYLASYFLGGLTGSLILGLVFTQFGWPACVAGVAFSLGAAVLLARELQE